MNTYNTGDYGLKQFSYVRWSENEKLIIVNNFDADYGTEFCLKLPKELVDTWQLKPGEYMLEDQLYKSYQTLLQVSDNGAEAKIAVKPLQSFIFKLQ